MLKRIFTAVLVTAGIALGAVALASPASAHTPKGGATCDGYFVTATSYEAGDTNTISSTFDSDTTTREFATADSITGAWPQDGLEHTWSGFVHTSNTNPNFSADYGPITLTCGEKPPVKDASASVETTDATCDEPGSATHAETNAHLVGTFDTTPGDHTATFEADGGHVFANGESKLQVTYTVDAQLTGDECLKVVTPVKPDVVHITECGTYGSVTPAETEGVTYEVRPSADVREGYYSVVATADEGLVFADGSTRKTVDVGNLGKYEECTTPTPTPPTTTTTTTVTPPTVTVPVPTETTTTTTETLAPPVSSTRPPSNGGHGNAARAPVAPVPTAIDAGVDFPVGGVDAGYAPSSSGPNLPVVGVGVGLLMAAVGLLFIAMRRLS